MEKKCLRDLDSEENWTRILRQPRPDQTTKLDWKPFWRIYIINLVQFLLALTFIFFSLEVGLGTGIAGFKEDFAIGMTSVGVFAISLAAYVTHLYRRSWNRRALRLRDEAVGL